MSGLNDQISEAKSRSTVALLLAGILLTQIPLDASAMPERVEAPRLINRSRT